MNDDIVTQALNEVKNGLLIIKLKNKQKIQGNLLGFDQFMNLYLENVKDITSETDTKSIGTIMLRGDNILIIAINKI